MMVVAHVRCHHYGSSSCEVPSLRWWPVRCYHCRSDLSNNDLHTNPKVILTMGHDSPILNPLHTNPKPGPIPSRNYPSRRITNSD